MKALGAMAEKELRLFLHYDGFPRSGRFLGPALGMLAAAVVLDATCLRHGVAQLLGRADRFRHMALALNLGHITDGVPTLAKSLSILATRAFAGIDNAELVTGSMLP